MRRSTRLCRSALFDPAAWLYRLAAYNDLYDAFVPLAKQSLAVYGYPLVALFASTAIVAIAVPIYNINQLSYRQALVDVRKQGRLNATVRTFVWGTLPIGAIIGGFIGPRYGPHTAIAISAGCSAAAAFWLVPFHERILPGLGKREY